MYIDRRPTPSSRMDAKDEGVVLKHGDIYDRYGARDVWVWEHDGVYYMHYDAADPDKGWLCALATSSDLRNWVKHGPVLDLGNPDDEDSKSASYGVVYMEEGTCHMFYLGTRNTTSAPERIPSFPYVTLKAWSESPFGPWTRQKDVIPFRPLPESYYSSTASPGHVIKYRDEYLQFFSASAEFFLDVQTVYPNPATRSDQSNDLMSLRSSPNSIVKRSLGIARTFDLNGSWQIDPEPILPLDEQIENSALYYEPEIDTWFLFTNHVGIEEGVGEYTDAIWVYWTKELEKWNSRNKAIVLDRHNCTWSRKVVGLPGVVKCGNQLAILYDGVENEQTSHCHRDIGLAWLDLPLSIPSSE